jgi:MOSC domain-containing protein YiiM
LAKEAHKHEALLKWVEEVLIEMAELAELSGNRTKWHGGLVHIHLARAASFKMEEFAEANFVAGRGIEGDRYFSIKIGPNDHRRNLTVTGVPLNHLVGQRFRVGAAVLFGGRLNFPCKYLEKLLGLPVYLPLYNRSGLNCRIEKGGLVRCGDPVEPFDDR